MADSEPRDPISRIHRFLGLKPSPEQQQKLADAEAAVVKMGQLKDQLVVALEEDRRQLEAAAEEQKKQMQVRMDQLREQFDHMPRDIDSVTEMHFAPDGRPIMEDMRFIHKWDDGYGNIIYTANTRNEIRDHQIVGPDKIRPLSGKVQQQRSSFEKLSTDQQAKIRAEFDSSSSTAAIKPYEDYLHSESLGRKFAQLKANPPRPFS